LGSEFCRLLGEAASNYSLSYCMKFGKRLHGNSVLCPKTTDCTNIRAAVAACRRPRQICDGNRACGRGQRPQLQFGYCRASVSDTSSSGSRMGGRAHSLGGSGPGGGGRAWSGGGGCGC